MFNQPNPEHNGIQLNIELPSLNIFMPLTDFISQQWQAANFSQTGFLTSSASPKGDFGK